MKCPVCENYVQEGRQECAFCGWTYAEDVTVYPALFADIQTEDYKKRYYTYIAELRANRTTEPSAESSSQALEGESYWDGMIDEDIDFSKTRPEDLNWAKFYDEFLSPGSEGQFRIHDNPENQGQTEDIQEFGDLFKRRSAISEEERRAEENATLANREFYRTGRNLEAVFRTEIYTEDWEKHGTKMIVREICDRIADGTFLNLHVGDYFYVTLENGEEIKLLLAGFGANSCFYYDIKNQRVKNYAVVVPAHCFEKKETMDKTIVFSMPVEIALEYEETYLHNEVLPRYAEMLQKALGHRILHYEDKKELQLMNHDELYGKPEWLGFPLFRFFPETRNARLGINGEKNCSYWLRDDMVPSLYRTNDEVHVDSNKKRGVRPYFCIG